MDQRYCFNIGNHVFTMLSVASAILSVLADLRRVIWWVFRKTMFHLNRLSGVHSMKGNPDLRESLWPRACGLSIATRYRPLSIWVNSEIANSGKGQSCATKTNETTVAVMTLFSNFLIDTWGSVCILNVKSAPNRLLNVTIFSSELRTPGGDCGMLAMTMVPSNGDTIEDERSDFRKENGWTWKTLAGFNGL